MRFWIKMRSHLVDDPALHAAAQSVAAAARTAPTDRPPSYLQFLFVAGGLPELAIDYEVAMLVLEPIFEADLPPELYGYRPGRNAQQAVVEVEELLFRGHPARRVVDEGVRRERCARRSVCPPGFEPIVQRYDERDSALYALSLGMGEDPIDEDELPFVARFRMD